MSEKAIGIKHDGEKPDMSLVPAAALLEEAAVWTFGKKKYSAYNWHNGIVYSRILSAMSRHLELLKAGIDLDYETGKHHGAAIRCCAAMLIQFSLEQRTSLDDRMKINESAKKLIESLAKGESIWDIIKESEIKNESTDKNK